MAEENNNKYIEEEEEETQIDWMEMIRKTWVGRKLVLKWCGIGIIVGLVVAFSLPKEYSSSISLSPESGGSGMSSSISSLAALAGFNMRSSGSEALTPDLYPNIVSSTPFVLELFDANVKSLDGELQTTLYDYMDEHQKGIWWGYIISAPFKALAWVKSLFSEEQELTEGNIKKDGIITMNQDQVNVAKALGERIGVSVDKKTGYCTISVKMQDPLIAATVADSVTQYLRKYITNYRTEKSKKDLAFTQSIYDDAKADYDKKQAAYAAYADANQNLITQRSRTELERLQNERTLAYNVYNQTAQQLQLAKAKVQEETPVLTVVQPAVVPLKGSPSKLKILLACIFLFAAGAIAWVAIGKDYYVEYKGKLIEKLKD